jgi:hypothetical protein
LGVGRVIRNKRAGKNKGQRGKTDEAVLPHATG